MNVAIVGYGSIAKNHADAILILRDTAGGEDLRIHAVMGRLQESTDAFAQEYGASVATTDLQHVLSDPEVDSVVICSPSGLHAEQVESALRAGKHVLCEIPLALSLEETDRLIAVSDQVDRRLMVCHTRRFDPHMNEARRMVEAGELTPLSMIYRYGFHRRENVNWRGRKRSWTDNLLWHHGGHVVDAALWLLGAEKVEVAAQVGLPSGNLDIPMDISLSLRTGKDQIISVALSYNTEIPLNDCVLIGVEQTLLIENNQIRTKDGVLFSPAGESPLDRPIIRQDGEFFTAVREGREPAVSARAIRASMAALQDAQDSLDSRLA